MQYRYTRGYCSAIKKNEIMLLAATWMKLEIIILSEVSQKDKEKHAIWSHLYAKSEIQHKQTCHRNRLTDIEEDIIFKEGRGMQGWGREESGVWNWQMQTITYIERINNKVPLPSTGNYIQYPVINHYRRLWKRIYIYIYIYIHTHIYT